MLTAHAASLVQSMRLGTEAVDYEAYLKTPEMEHLSVAFTCGEGLDGEMSLPVHSWRNGALFTPSSGAKPSRIARDCTKHRVFLAR